MKVLAFLIVFLFVSAHGKASSESESSEEDIKELAQMLKDKFNATILFDVMRLAKLVDDKCPDIEEKLAGAAEETVECISDIELGSDTFCSLIRKNWAKCSKPSLDAIASCLPDESKDLSYMAGKILFAVVDEACNSTVEQFLELFNPCGMTENGDAFKECTDIVKTFTSHKDELPSKSLVCSMTPRMKNCAKAHQTAFCKNPITRQSSNQFFEAIEDALQDDCEKLNKA